MLPGPRIYDPYRRLDRVVRRSDRILKRMFAARMISGDEYRAALAESPNIARLEKKVEKTMAAPPPEESPPVPLPVVGPGLIESPPGKETGEEPTGSMPPPPELEEAPHPLENAASTPMPPPPELEETAHPLKNAASAEPTS
jgi:monofunctional biosynthetic peptidoglycan transglycosylase